MPNNISVGLNFVVATQTATWATVGLTSTTIIDVYKSNNGNPVSYNPARNINTLTDTGIISGQGYQINAKTAMDKTAFFSPPNPTGGGGGIVTLS